MQNFGGTKESIMVNLKMAYLSWSYKYTLEG